MKEELKQAFLDAPCREESIQKTIASSKAAFAESACRLSWIEFLHSQLPFIRKRWWVMQAILLFSTGVLLNWMDSDFGIRRCLGTAAPLFAVLILPELWKNCGCAAVEVEGTTRFTLRQIYAARMLLFAGMDVLLISLFFTLTAIQMTLWELAIHFLFPLSVSCGICLFCLYNIRSGSEVLPLFLCFVWAGIWLLIILDDRIFYRISALGWGLLFAASILFLTYCIIHGQKQIQKQWEAKPIWN